MNDSPTVLMAPSSTLLQLLCTHNEQEIFRAFLPSPARAHPRALSTLLEGLALWTQQPARVVWSADNADDGSCTALLDALGFGERRLHFHVEWTPLASPRARTLGGPASFRALRSLAQKAGVR